MEPMDAPHRYLIEAQNTEYWADDFMLTSVCLSGIRVDSDGTIVSFDIFDPIVAIHDFNTGFTLADFREQKALAIENIRLVMAKNGNDNDQTDVQ